jgi:hypothetical protein
MPALFIHGTSDRLVKISHMHRIFHVYSGEK